MSSTILEIDPAEFHRAFNSQSGFFGAVRRSTVLLSDEEKAWIEDRDTSLRRLYERIIGGQYFPSPVRATIISNKGAGIPRPITSLAIEDACVYHFCTYTLSKYLPLRRAANTYAGWSSSGATRENEDKELEKLTLDAQLLDGEYVWSTQLNPMQSRKIWKRFQQAAVASASQGDFSHFVTFDINTFFNSVDLNILERKLRGIASYQDQSIIDLLFLFLRNWNRANLRYATQSVGLPIEEVGDSSRTLANFYLQDYDRAIQEVAAEHGSNTRFLRYADDQWFMTESRRDAEYLLITASTFLAEIGLSINAGKVHHIESRDDFLHYWNIPVFEPLTRDEPSVEDFVQRAFEQDLCDRTSLISRPRKRQYVVQKLMWLTGHDDLCQDTRSKLSAFARDTPQLTIMNADQMSIVFRSGTPFERVHFLAALAQEDSVTLYSEFRFRMEKFLFTLENICFTKSIADAEVIAGLQELPKTLKQQKKLRRQTRGHRKTNEVNHA